MDIYLEFISNHTLLFIALLVVVLLILQSFIGDAMRKYKLITPAESINLINRNNAALIDVRAENEYRDGHIADAIHIPISKLKDKTASLDKYKNRPVVFYCKTGSFSSEASKLACQQGLSDVYSIKGGLMSWQDADLPLTKKK